ncbi:MAG: LysR family transcriptional regulator [Azoarcus sp. PHD]|jgi:DNA-binding transcriptional LysR family regulator|nr:MAG: LysR family transcriptional regulator [Azoarcus sp. PHD]
MKQLHDVDLRLLRVFDVVVRCGGLSAAQAELNVGQSTISMQLAQLEVRLGARLCERGRGGFRLTEEGRAIHEASQRLLSAVDGFRLEADQLKKTFSGTLNLGLIDNTVTDTKSPLRGAIQRFLARGKDVGVHVYIGTPSELEQRVLDGRLHLAVGHFPFQVSGLAALPLYDEAHGLFCAADHAVLKADIGGGNGDMLAQVRSEQVVARGYLRRRDLDLLNVNVAAFTVDNIEAQAILILSAGCIGFLPIHYAAQWVGRGELVQILPKSMVLVSRFTAIRRRLAPPPLVRSFLSDLTAESP